MKRLSRGFIIFLTLTFSLRCQTSSAAPINLKPKSQSTRDQDEAFVICFEQNMLCHENLRKAALPQPSNWSSIVIAVLGGIVAGAILESKIKH